MEHRLGEFFRVKHGYAFKGESFCDDGPYIVTTPGNFEAKGGLKRKGDKEKRYSGTFPAEFILEPGDLIVALTDLKQTAPILGASALISDRNLYLHNQRIGKVVDLQEQKMDRLYLFYLFNWEFVRKQIRATATGATVRHTAPTRIYDVRVDIPPLPTQRRIAGILSAYDDLIENNTKRIKILEEMARALYREWFVHFRFPGHEKVKLVDSPLGQIPEGWEVTQLSDVRAGIPNAINGGPFGSKLGRKDYVEVGVPVIRGANLTTTGRFKDRGYVFVSSEKAATLRSNMARPGDIVVTQRGTLGQVARIPKNARFPEFVISQSQMKVTLNPERVDNDYAFYVLKSTESVERLKGLASSSGVPHINLATLREFHIRIPPLPLQRKFGKQVNPMEMLIENWTQQNQVLRETRDLILPRLISGEIDVDGLNLPENT